MTTQHAATTPTTRFDLRRAVGVGAVGGAIAGMMMAMVEMIYGLLSSGHTLFDAPMAIWAFVGGRDQFGEPSDHVAAIVLGMGGHLANSVMLGVVFALVVAGLVRSRGLMTPVALGTMYGVTVWVVMRYVVLPLNQGTADLFTTNTVSPQWLWYVSHAVFGMTLGLVYARYAAGRARQLGA